MNEVAKDILVKSPDLERFELQQRLARLFISSGLFSDIKNVSETQAIAQAFTKIALGESMGFSAAESMTGIDIVQGRIAVSAQLRAARMQRAGFEWDVLQLDDQGCRLLLKKNGAPIVTTVVDPDGTQIEVAAIVSFTAEDAKRAGLSGKDNYMKYKPDMFFARAITRAQRWYAPGVLSLDVMSTEEVLSEPGLSGESKVHVQALRTKQKDESMKKEYHTPTISQLPEADVPAPIKVKLYAKAPPVDEPVPVQSENFDAEPTQAPESRVEQARSAQAKLEQKRRSAAESVREVEHVAEIKSPKW